MQHVWRSGALAAVWLGTVVAQQTAPPAAIPPSLARGAVVTFERLLPADAAPEVHTTRARLLSLAVERGETPSPFLSQGPFRATYQATVALPIRDKYHFRAEGRGSFRLLANGEVVLDGSLRPGKPLATAQPVRLKKGDNALQVVFESSAMGDGQFRLSWSGPEFGFEPLLPEQLRHDPALPALVAGQQLQAGHQLFVDRHCARCHEPAERRIGESAFGELDASGPDLRQAGARLQRDWLAAWLLEPHRFRPDATMPSLPLDPQGAADVATWLAGLGTPLTGVTLPADGAKTGGALFLQFGCVGCHVPPERPAAEATLGARLHLGHVAQKWHPAGLVEYLQDPRRNHPHVRMPDFELDRDQALALTAYLLAPAPGALPVANGDADRGRKLAQQHRCDSCHALDLVPDERRYARLPNLKAERGCLAATAAARGGAPDHRLDADQRAALAAFLPFATTAPFRRAPLDYFTRQVTAQRCTACHGLDGQPSVWATVAEQLSASAPLPAELDPRGQGVPALTWVGGKLQPSWIQGFLLGKEKSPRPWLHARMPRFHGRGEGIAAGLVREHGYGPQDEPPTPADAQSAIHGERLVQMGQGFGCVQCHALGGKPAVQVFERAGIDLVTARQRLRHEYYTRWLADPPRIDPDARMPRYADSKGKTPIGDVLGGDAAAQFEAIWQFLGGQLPRR